MKKRKILKGLVLVILFITIVVLTNSYLKGLKEEVKIIVASQNIDAYTVISEDMLIYKTIGYKDKVEFFFHAYEDMESIVGSASKEEISKGEVLVNNSMIIPKDQINQIKNSKGEVEKNAFLETDYRVGFLSIDKKSALGGNLSKGNYIDIIYVSKSDDTGGLYSTLLLQNIKVSQVEVNVNSSQILDVSMELKPGDALLLSLAKQTGELDILLSKKDNPFMDVQPSIPQDLYQSLIDSGYMMLGGQVNEFGNLNGSTASSDIEAIHNKIKQAEMDLSNAKRELEAALERKENDGENSQSLMDLIKALEISVNNLELVVNENKTMLLNLENKLDKGGE